MTHRLVLVCLPLALLVAACGDDAVCTTDEDGDGFGVGCEADCDDGDPLHHGDCLTCSDPDGDGYGLGCDPGLDCDSVDGRHWADCGLCTDDPDGDGAGPSCDLGDDCDAADPNVWAACGSCTDGDGDGSYVGCDDYVTVEGPDCDDDDPDSFATCGYCRDEDGDGYHTGCDAYTDTAGPDCDDDNADAWDTCGGCRDADGDGYFTGCNAYTTVAGEDCNDASPLHWADCGACTDVDLDGYGASCDLGTDCNDTDRDNWASCASCVDADTDSRYVGCDAYVDHLGPDCDDTLDNHWSDCGTCTDVDEDGFGSGICDIAGDDCDDGDGNRYPTNTDATLDGTDQDCDDFDTAAAFTDTVSDTVFSPHWTTTYYVSSSSDLNITSAYYASSFYSINLGGSGSIVETQTFDTSACDAVLWRYEVKRGSSAPSAFDQLLLQYWNGGAWITTDTYAGNGAIDADFVTRIGAIAAADARRAGFRLRLLTSGGATFSDDFYIDNFASGCAPDVDGDGTWNETDCAPTDADHWSDCGGSCVDTDGDDYGPGCDLGPDTCGPTNPAVNPAAVDDSTDGTDQNCDGVDGPLTSQTYSASPALAITDSTGNASTCAAAGAQSSQIVVADIGTIFDVDVTINFTHTRPQDLDVWLHYNNGSETQCVQLTTDNPGVTPPSPDALANFTSTVFSDEAAFGIDATLASGNAVPAPPFTATFRPEAGTALSLVDGLAHAATWTLYVNDDTFTGASSGSLTSWSLNVQRY